MLLPSSVSVVCYILGICALLVCGVNRCNDPQLLAPVVNESRSDISLRVAEGSDVVLRCSAPYSVKWVKLHQKETTPISYTVSQLTNDTSAVTVDQTSGPRDFTSVLQLTDVFDHPRAVVFYSCISTQDFDASTNSDGSPSTIDKLRLTKVNLRVTNALKNDPPPPRGDFDCLVNRKALAAEALLQTLNGHLLASRSATKTLEKWCGDHKLARVPTIVAKQMNVGRPSPPPPPLAKTLLHLTSNDTVRYRSVELRCGDKVLSVADNWYVSDRLTLTMNSALDNTNTPFGKVVAPFEPFRQTYSVKFLWRPLPNGWETDCSLASAASLSDMPDRVLQHQATVSTKEGLPISFVDERYTKSMFAFL